METAEIKGFCTLCRSRCGTMNTVSGNRLIKVRADRSHPTGAAMCMKGRAAPELVEHPDRIVYPMRRTAPKGAADPQWRRITWDEALAEVAMKLDEIRRSSGAESVVFGVTTPSGTAISDSIDWIERFVWSFGSPNMCHATEICNWHKDVAHKFTFGCAMPTADYENADVIVLWGTNPANTWLAQADAIARGRRRGAKLIVVDPRPTELARTADLWLRVRPGTDGALALGIVNRMLGCGDYDRRFVSEWTNGPLLVRTDNGRFLREKDLDRAAVTNRYAIWNSTAGRIELIEPTQPGQSPDAALDGLFIVGLDDALGRRETVPCEPAFACYARAAAGWTADRVETETGVPENDIFLAARLLKSGQRIAYHAWSGVGQHTNASQTERSIATLYALTGAFDTVGSNRELTTLPTNPLSDFARLPPEQRDKALGLTDRPLGPPAQGWVTARDVYHAIVHSEPYRVRALFAFGTNMILTQPDSAAAEVALRSLEFHVHCDLFETPSARYADIFLPVNTPWEREGLRCGFEINERAVELIQLRPRMVEPRGESRADYDIVVDLATRLGMRDEFFGGSVEAGWNHKLAPLNLDVRTLREKPGGIYRHLDQRERKYSVESDQGARGFATETARVELYSEKLLRYGYSPIPCYVGPTGGTAHAHKELYPFWLTSIKSGYFCHSQHRGIASLRRRAKFPVVELSADLAAEKQIVEGDWLVIATAHGTARFEARVLHSLAREVLVAEYGWWQACDAAGLKGCPTDGPSNSNFNGLVSSAGQDPISGSSALRSVACNVSIDPCFDKARRHWKGWRDFVVASITDEAEGVKSFTFSAKDNGPLPDFLPGQHLSIEVSTLGSNDTTRAYSLVGPSTQGDRRTYTIAVRHQRGVTEEGVGYEGTMSSYLHRSLRTGQTVRLRSPDGSFVLPVISSRPVVMFAGGIGITPFLSYLESVAQSDAASHEMRLFYANRHHLSHAFKERIDELRARVPSLTVVNCYSDPLEPSPNPQWLYGQHLKADVVTQDLIARRPLFYFCGPPQMTKTISQDLIARGVPSFDIFSETFRSPPNLNLDASQRYNVTFLRSRSSAVWTPERGTLLSFGESLGVSMPSGCRVGQCESCSVAISSGSVSHLHGDGPEEENSCFSCQAVPSSDLILDI